MHCYLKELHLPIFHNELISHEFVLCRLADYILTSKFCIIVFQRDLDFKISVKFEGEISEVEEETKYKMR